MLGTTIDNHQISPSQLFRGIRFLLLGFDPLKKSQVSRKLIDGGGVDAGLYGPNCTHVIVDKLVYDDPLCVAARQDGKIVVSSLWVDHSIDFGAPVDTTSVMYVPVRDLNGIPGARSLVICLTGYQRADREDIMTMVELMGAQVSKPLIATKVTHLICYKFEGEKYLLAKKMRRIKLINHQWLEDCLKAWEILPEADYSKSGYELEMEAEARDSEDEPEGVTTRNNEANITSPHHSLLSKQEIENTISNTSASNMFSNAQETVSVTMKTTSDHFSNPHEIKIKCQETHNVIGVASDPSNHYEAVSSSSVQNNISASASANKFPQNEAKAVISASDSMKDPIRTTPVRTTPSAMEMKSTTSSAKRLNKLNLGDAFNMSSAYNGSAFCSVDEQTHVSSNKRNMDASCGSSKLQQMNQNNVVETAFQVLKEDPPIEISPAKRTPSNISERKPLSSKGKNVICDVPISKTSTAEIEDLNAVQRPQKEYKENSLSTKSNSRDVGMAENLMQSPSAVSSDLQKSSTLNSESNERSAGSNSKPVRKKSISKKFSAPKLSKKSNVNQKGSIFLKNPEPGIDDENVSKSQQFEKVSSVVRSSTEPEKGVISGMKSENMSEKTSLCMDDETEPPDDKDEASKEKHGDGEPMEENTKGNVNVADPTTDKNNDETTGDLASEIPLTKKVKKNVALSMKEVTDNKSLKKNEVMIDNNFGNQEIMESTPNRAKGARRKVNDLENTMEVKRAGVRNDPEYNGVEKDDEVDVVMDIDVNKKETKRNKRPPTKSKKDVNEQNGTDLEKSVEAKRASVCNDPEYNNDQNDDDVDADMDIENVLNKKGTTRNKRPLSKAKKDVSKKKESDLEKKLDVERAEGVCNGPEHNNNIKENGADADIGIENAVNKKETTKNDASKKNATDLEKSVEVKRAEGVCNDPQHKKEENDHNGADKDADMDTENSLNKKETKRNKRPPSRTKKDYAKAVNKKAKPTPNQPVEMCDLEEAQKENVQIHVNNQSTGNKHVFKPAKGVPKKNIDKADSDVLKDEPMWFILTGHTLQRKEFQQLISRLKGRVCRVKHNWSYQATHFIVPDPIKRTEKFFAAAASGRWILKTDYLSASNQAGKFLPEETYEWHKNGLSEDGQINLEAPRKWRLLKEKTGHGAYYGMKIVIYGECIAPPLDTLKRAVKAGDGTILATSPPYTRFLSTGIDFAVVSPGMPHVDVWVQEFLKHEIPCVTADYLVEYVCKPGYPLERHVLFGTNVWAERSYNDLKNRLEEDISEPRTPIGTDVACEVCGARDRGEEMLICGDEGGLIGCGVGTHIDCCDPPLEDVPEEDWFCSKCSKKTKNSKDKKSSKNKGK